MPFPPVYSVTYSYSGFAPGLGDGSFPGAQLDADMTGLQDSIEGLSDFAGRDCWQRRADL